MKEIHIASRNQWREWLSKNHDREKQGIWLVFHKKETGKSAMEYEESVEEALCFGWIDSIIKNIDSKKYCRKFTPRKSDSKWSALNKKRAAKLIKEGKMTEYGLAKIDESKRLGFWNMDSRPRISFDMPEEFSNALKHNRKAQDHFEKLSPTDRKQFIGWILFAKRLETRQKRIDESIRLLEQGQKLGLK